MLAMVMTMLGQCLFLTESVCASSHGQENMAG